MLSKSKSINENYAARIVRIDEIHPIPNAHSLVKAVLGTDTVVVSNDMKVGDIVAYFPEGCCISEKYLGAHNLFDASGAEKNSNYEDYKELGKKIQELKTKPNKSMYDVSELQEMEARRKRMVGFFNKQGRVRCIKLRGEISMGYVAPVETLEKVWPELKSVLWSHELGNNYDMVGDEMLCWKYLPPIKKKKTDRPVNRKTPWYLKPFRHLKKFDRIIPGFFRHHYDTMLLEINAHLIDPEDVITESIKIHGTSICIANLPVNRKLNLWERLLKKLGVKVNETEFGDIYSTHHVIQNRYINPFTSRKEPRDEYQAVNDDFMDFLTPGMTVYGEIVGYKPSGKPIQSPKGIDHDYGCRPGQYKFMPYRITETDSEGNAVEWSINAVMGWVDIVRQMLPEAEQDKIMNMVILYHGKAGDQYGLYERIKNSTTHEEYDAAVAEFTHDKEFDGFIPKRLESFDEFVKNKWRVAWIEAMRADKQDLGFELHEPLCRNPRAPREGIVIRIDHDTEARAWKLKTRAHTMLAQRAKDAGEIDSEDIV